METGSGDSDTGWGSSCGQMGLNIWGSGLKEKHMVKESSFIQMEITMKEIGAITRHVVTGSIFMKTEISTKESGRTMFSTDMERKDGRMVRVIKDRITKEQNMELDSTNGLMGLNTTGTGITTLSKASESTHGLMEGSTEANGKIPTCTELDLTSGPTEESSPASTITIRNMDTESTRGQTIGNTEAGGRKENRTG